MNSIFRGGSLTCPAEDIKTCAATSPTSPDHGPVVVILFSGRDKKVSENERNKVEKS